MPRRADHLNPFWAQSLVASRLLVYEVAGRVHAQAPDSPLGDDARQLIDRATLLDLSVGILHRALEPFPVPVRTLDALHLATMDFPRANEQTFTVATYDRRLAHAAQALGFPLADL